MDSPFPPQISARAQRGQNAIRLTLPPSNLVPGPRIKKKSILPIGIVGAGAAGLCAALILQRLNLPFEILEAASPNEQPNIGGRVFTYKFSAADYDYFDVGAMRFPYIRGMKPTFDLINYVGLTGKLIPYYFKSPTGNTASYFNDVRHVLTVPSPPPTTDIFGVGVSNGGTVPDVIARQDAGAFMAAIYDPFAKAFKENFDLGWNMVKPFDVFSTRLYLTSESTIPKEPILNLEAAITWIETNNLGTNMFDQSFVEGVMDYLEFGVPNPHVDPTPLRGDFFSPEPPHLPKDVPIPDHWYCLLGGTQSLTDEMFSRLGFDGNQVTGNQVTAIALDASKESVIVDIDGKPSKTYSHVISTMSLGCLQTVNLRNAELSYEQKTAIRTCHYSDSTKVGIKFRRRWWEQGTTPIHGGQSYTDRTTRCVVYPSYGIDSNGAAVMIASYNWEQDAARFGALVKGHGSPEEKELIDIILNDMALIHNVNVQLLKDEYEDHFAWTWSHYKNTRGAFAFFGPGQFWEQFPFISRPAGGGLLHFAGEATSVHHAWISGALASAWRAVAEIVMVELGLGPDAAKEYMNARLWPDNPTLRLMEQPEEVDMELLLAQVAIGGQLKSGR